MLLINHKPVKLIKFPAGEVSPDLNSTEPTGTQNHHIEWRFESTDEVFILCQLVDAIRGKYNTDNIYLFVPYFPFSRQDRRVNIGESNSLKVICDILKSLNLKRIYTYDAHSLLLSAYLGELLFNTSQEQIFIHSKLLQNSDKKYVLVSPDQGASKKTQSCAKLLDVNLFGEYKDVQVLQCLKTRDLKNGNVNTLKVFYEGQDFSDYHIIVVDDICDGGATFIAIAQELLRLGIKGKFLSLYTTHGIYSKGKTDLSAYYDNIECHYLQSNPQNPYPTENYVKKGN